VKVYYRPKIIFGLTYTQKTLKNHLTVNIFTKIRFSAKKFRLIHIFRIFWRFSVDNFLIKKLQIA